VHLNAAKHIVLNILTECGIKLRKTVFIKNAFILTFSAVVLRFAGIVFKVWLASAIGSEGIGLYQLIFSFYVLISTFASSGISTAVTRLIADELVLGSKNTCQKILSRAISITLILALFSAAITFFGADIIAKVFLGDERAAAAIKILPLSLPFMGVSSCFRGYFIARRRATPNALSQIFEQGIRIAVVMLLVKRFINKGLSALGFAVMFGDVISEAIGFLWLFVSYKLDAKKLTDLKGRIKTPFSTVKKLLNISVPITSGRYLNSLLRTAENVLVPKNLAKYPLNSTSALSQFGMIKGMALPILFFPSAVLNSISTLLIPEMSQAVALGRKEIVKSTAKNILKLTAFVGFIFSGIFLAAGDKIGFLIYKEKDVGYLIKALAPIVPLMYLDSISDGILKGLDQQSYTFKSSVSDSALRIILILLTVPFFGLKGFIVIMYFSNCYTCFLHVGRLLKISGAKFKFLEEIALPIAISVAVSFLSKQLLSYFDIASNLVYIIFLSTLSLLMYFIIVIKFKLVGIDFLKGIFKNST